MKILITGCAGTWGTAFTELLKDKHDLIGVDNTEKAVAEYKRKFPRVKSFMEDFSEFDFEERPVDLVIHLAAYKHIDLCELNPDSAIENNVTKTATLFKKANTAKVDIMFVSTDKAVEPQSIYGFTKALGESLCKYYRGCLVRSGNIVGANGSVVHVWREAIKNNLPIKVTDMDMERYFIQVEEAVKMAWSGYQKKKRLVLIDIGGHRKLSEIIESVLSEFDLTIDTYNPGIEIVGRRPGERLIDKIKWEDE